MWLASPAVEDLLKALPDKFEFNGSESTVFEAARQVFNEEVSKHLGRY